MAKKQYALRNILLAAILLSAALLPAERAWAAASFVVSPATTAVSPGSQFTVSIVISADQAVNAAQGTIIFPTDRLQVVQVLKTGSILQFWSQEPSFSNANGTINFSGGLPSPGFVGFNGQILKITFKASGNGPATVNITQGAILANDGLGTNVLNKIAHGVYAVSGEPASTAPPEIANEVTSRSYPNSNFWYNKATVDFSWIINPDVDRIAYELTQTSGAKPTQGYDPTDHVQYSLSDKSDGVWYFNLQLRTRGVWGKILTKKIKIDRVTPSIVRMENLTTDRTDPRPAFSWSASDEASGIKAYRLRVNGGEWLEPAPRDASSMSLPLQTPGKHSLVIEAEDHAGNKANMTKEFTVEPIATPIITEYPRSLSKLDSPDVADQVIVIRGRAPGAVSVKLRLRNRDDEFSISSDVAADGSWKSAYSGGLSSGTWTLTAQAEDARGALSFETEPVIISMNDKIGSLIRFFAAWGALGLVGALVLALMAFLILAAWARLKHYRLKLKKDIMTTQMELIRDFEQVEKDMQGHTLKARRELSEDMDVLAEDIHKELNKLKDDVN
jgi:hypothetical protein